MPYVNIKVVSPVSREAKADIVREVTDTLHRILGKNPESTYVVIEELDPDNWGVGGALVTERRKRD